MVKKLSVFFPTFNEEGNVEFTVKKAIDVLEKQYTSPSEAKLEYEIIIVNDGSTDKTGSIADSLAKKNPKIRVIHHDKNLGYGEALKSGFYNAKYDTIVYTDGDGQFDFSEVSKFLEKIETHDLLIGYRIKRQDPILRILFKKGWSFSLFLAYGLTLKDVDCGFKMIKREVLERIPHLESTRGAMINAELAIKAKKGGFKVGQVGVHHYPRLSGKPTGASLRVIFRSYFDLLRLWWKLKEERNLLIIFVATLVLASLLRFWQLSSYMTFLGDEGRDGLIMKKMASGDIPFIGPPTSVGNIYLGPLYYYMMFVPMVMSNFNPVSAAAMNAVIGVLTVALIYYLGKIFFGRIPGLIAAFLYAISPITIIYSRSSWNPNPAPFFALLGIFSLYKMHLSGNFLWLVLTGFSFAAALQMHYLALILLPIGLILWLYEICLRKNKTRKNLFIGTSLGIVIFFLLMSPLFIFDLKHQFLNYRAITALLTESSSVNGNIISNITRIPALYSDNLIGRYLAGENYLLQIILAVLILIPLLFRRSWTILALNIWLWVGLFGVSFYQQDVYDHYLGFLNPAPFLLLGGVAAFKFFKTKFAVFFWVILIAALIIVNLQKNPLNHPPNNQLQKTQEIAKFIIRETKGEPFNFALIAENNYDAAYQFYLDHYGFKPKQVPFDITDQLFVVCEDAVCQPVGHPKQEISHFGWAKIDMEWEIFGVRIYKLVSNPEGK